MKVWKLITISLISSILTIAVSSVLYAMIANAADTDDIPLYKDYTAGYTLVSSSYHFSMNNYFNEKIDILVKILKKDDFAKDPNFTSPKDGVCVDTNVSSYCVSMG